MTYDDKVVEMRTPDTVFTLSHSPRSISDISSIFHFTEHVCFRFAPLRKWESGLHPEGLLALAVEQSSRERQRG